MFTPGVLQRGARIVDIWCKVPGKNPFGEVSEGCLKVASHYLERPILTPTMGSGNRYKLSFPDSDIQLDFHPDDTFSLVDHRYGEVVMPWTVLFIAKGTGSVYGNEGCPLALVLKKSTEKKGSFVRVGLGASHDRSHSKTAKWRRDNPTRIFSII